jgi:purine-nucleoside phosphorylase
MQSAVDFVKAACGHDSRQPGLTGVILGSGLGRVADELAARGGRVVAFQDIPGMPVPRIAGHHGRLVTGTIGPHHVAMLQGRVHLYEGHDLHTVTWATRLLCRLGMQRLVITNAAGGIRSGFAPGHLMLIDSHLVCPMAATWPAPRNSPSQDPDGLTPRRGLPIWTPALRDLARSIPTSLTVHEGVYAMMPGPCYETPAEIRMLRSLGADAVGMSTVPEAVTAAANGVAVLGVSCITNVAAGLSSQKLDHAEVTQNAATVEAPFSRWLWKIIENMGTL